MISHKNEWLPLHESVHVLFPLGRRLAFHFAFAFLTCFVIFLVYLMEALIPAESETCPQRWAEWPPREPMSRLAY